jgi:hypothetical protein
MNEERDREDLPGVPPLSPGERRSEFDRMRGEIQHQGTRVLAVPSPTPPAPVGIAPPDPRNVVSNFDTRPIGAYDFAHSENATMGNGEVTSVIAVNFEVPDGYTAVLRRVRVEWTPPASMLIAQPAAGASPTDFLEISLLRSGGVIPNNTVQFLGDLDSYEWDTHQVFGFWETMGLQLAVTGAFAIPANIADAVFVGVTFFGVLIPTKSRPPETEIASDPVVVRDYDTLKNTMPDTGAAGVGR